MARLVELIVRLNDTNVLRGFSRIARGAEETNASVSRSFRASQTQLGRTARAAESVGRVMTTVGVGMVAVGYYGVKASTNFAASMEQIHTQAGASQAEVTRMTKAIQAYVAAGKSAATPQQLSQGLFYIESVGLRGAAAFKALKLSEDAAAVSGANLNDVSSAFASAIRASHTPASQMTTLMAEMNAVVGMGKLHFQDLTDALSHGMIPAFQAVGLNAKDALASIATLTRLGYQATTIGAQLPTALHYLSHPTTAAQGVLSQIGIQPGQLAQDFYKPHGLLAALTDLQTHMAGLSRVQQSDVLQSILPGGRGRIMLSLIENLKQYGSMLDLISAKTKQWSGDINSTHSTALWKFHVAWARIQNDLVLFGNAITPIVMQWLPKLTALVTGVARWFSNLSPAIRSFVGYAAIAFGIGGPMLIGLAKVLEAVKALRAMFVSLTVVEKAAALAGVGPRAAAAGAGATGAAGVSARYPVAAVGLDAALRIANIWRAQNAKSRAAQEKRDLSNISGPTGPQSGGLLGLLGIHLPSWMGGARGGLVTPHGIRRFQMGGPSGSDTIPAWLSAGEGVLNRTAMSGLGVSGLAAMNSGGVGGGFGGVPIEITVNSILDGRVIAKAVLRQTLLKAARGPSSLTGGALSTGVAPPTGQ